MDKITSDISIIIPVYNAEKYLAKCLGSVIHQTYKNIEIIAVDDGSMDGSRKILTRYALLDARIVLLLSDKNKGTLLARKQGVLAARGEYLLFLDSDDMLELNACEHLIKEMRSANVDILHFNMRPIASGLALNNWENIFIRAYCRPIHKKIEGRFLLEECFVKRNLPFNIWGYLIKAGLLKKVYEAVPEEYVCTKDDIYVLFIMLSFQPSYKGLPQSIYYRYRYGIGISASQFQSEEHFEKICKDSKVVRLLREFLIKNGTFGLHKKAFYALKAHLYMDYVSRWMGFKEGQRARGFDILSAYWDPCELITHMGRQLRGREASVAGWLYGAQKLKSRKTDVKTVAVFYPDMYNGGAQRVIAKLIDIWLSMGLRVILLTEEPPHRHDYTPENKVPRIVLPRCMNGRSLSERLRVLNTAIEEYGIDLAVCNEDLNPAILWDALLIKAKGASFIMHTHSSFVYAEMGNNRINRTLNKDMFRIYQLCDAVLVLSRVDLYFWSRHCDNVRLIANPVCFDAAHVKQSKLSGARLLWVGRLYQEHKRYMDVIDIMKTVIKARPDAVLTVVGGYIDKTIDKSFAKRIKRQGLASHIIYKGWQDDVYPYYSAADIFLSTSACEGFPTTLVESKAFGVPCITYELPYLEMHRDNAGMIKVPIADTKRMAVEIIALLNDPKRLRDMGKAARESLHKYLEIDQRRVWAQIIEDVKGGHRQPSVPADDETKRLYWHTLAMYEERDNFRMNKYFPVASVYASMVSKTLKEEGLRVLANKMYKGGVTVLERLFLANQ